MKKNNKIYMHKATQQLYGRPNKASSWKKQYNIPAHKRPSNRLVNKNGRPSVYYRDALGSIADQDEKDEVRWMMKDHIRRRKELTLKQALLKVRNPKNKIVTYLSNMGVDLDGLVADLHMKGVSVSTNYLLDPNHWHFAPFSGGKATIDLPSGGYAYFVFFYEAGYTVEVSA